jgi:hypothetical protein
MRPQFQKRSALKLAGRIIPQSGGYNTPKLALGFIPVINYRKILKYLLENCEINI